MNAKITEIAKKTVTDIANKPISRKEAIKKTGYIAISAATMMLLLNSPAQASSSNKHSNDKRHSNGGRHSNG